MCWDGVNPSCCSHAEWCSLALGVGVLAGRQEPRGGMMDRTVRALGDAGEPLSQQLPWGGKA